jgi:hypothetical protein
MAATRRSVAKICATLRWLLMKTFKPGADQLVGQHGLHVGKADHQLGLQRHDLVDLAVQKALMRGFSARARGGRTV